MKDANAAQAAARVGYKHPEVLGARICKDPAVKAEIERRLTACEVTADRVIAELGRIAFSDLEEIYEADGTLKPVGSWPERARRAVASIECEELFEWDAQARERKPIGHLRKVKLWDKGQALQTLARYFKLLTDNISHSGTVTLEQLLAGTWKEDKPGGQP